MRASLWIVTIFLISLTCNSVWAQNSSDTSKENTPLQDSLTTVVSIIGIFGAIGALIFSGMSQRNQSKSQYYQIFKDLDDEYVKLVDGGSALGDLVKLPFSSLSLLDSQTVYEVEMYRWKYYTFHEKIAHLAITGMIPEEIARYYALTFSMTLLYMDLEQDPKKLQTELNFTMEWCKKENITKYNS